MALTKSIGVKALMSLLLLASGASQITTAATVDVVGSFNDPTATNFFFYNRTFNQDDENPASVPLPNNLVSDTDSVAYFGWGMDVRESYQNHQIIQSHFWFNGTGSEGSSNPTTINYGEAFSLGMFTYTNEETVLSGGYVEIDFQMDIQVNGLGLVPVEYRIGIDNTTNPAADTAELLSMPSDLSFNIDGTEYLLSFHGFSRDGGSTFETFATLPEDQQTSAEIYATITAVPLPAAAWLLGSGLIGLAGFARLKSRK